MFKKNVYVFKVKAMNNKKIGDFNLIIMPEIFIKNNLIFNDKDRENLRELVSKSNNSSIVFFSDEIDIQNTNDEGKGYDA